MTERREGRRRKEGEEEGRTGKERKGRRWSAVCLFPFPLYLSSTADPPPTLATIFSEKGGDIKGRV